MTETERLALTAAFLTAVVVAGLSLSYVPHVELVTLVVFASGILLGSGRGALIGAVGMPLYVFSNSALKGFPPSPLPVLAAQALGMMIAGAAGGWWRRYWFGSGIPRRSAFVLLPVLGLLLAAGNQTILNASYVMIMSDEAGPRTALFLSGMAFGFLDMVWNGVVFAAAGPAVASVLRRLARRKGWWAASTTLTILLLLTVGSRPLLAQTLSATSPDSVLAPPTDVAPPDSIAAESVAVVDIVAAPEESDRRVLRPLDPLPDPLWGESLTARASVLGAATYLVTEPVRGGELSRVTVPAIPTTLDRWGLGWGRVRYTYDGLPLRGPVHGFDEPPDIPFAWRGTWHQKRTATGTSVDVPLPEPAEGTPWSQISLTTGSLNRRSAEFGLFRNLGPVNIGLDFMDRGGDGLFEVEKIKHDRLWLHLSPVQGRPTWTLDLSTSNETRDFFTGGEMGRDARRLQASIRGPFLGGETRFAAQLRRQALQTENLSGSFGEVVYDGFTIRADWAAPLVSRLNLGTRYEKDRRRGIFPEGRSFHGFHGEASWGGRWGVLAVAAEMSQPMPGRRASR
jgi:hypothetical protein